MEWITLPPRGSRLKTPMNVVHAGVVLLFVATGLTFILMGFFIRNFATLQPDAAHSLPVHEHGGTFFLNPVLGRLYANMPWIWLITLGGSVLITVLRTRFEKRSK